MPQALFFSSMCSWHMHSTQYISDTEAVNHMSHTATKAYTVAQRISVSSVSSQQLTADNTPAFVTNHSSATYFLRGPNRSKSLCSLLPTTLVTGYRITAGRMCLIYSPDLMPSNFHPFGPLPKQLAGKEFATTQM